MRGIYLSTKPEELEIYICLYQARGVRGIYFASVSMNSDKILDGVIFFKKIYLVVVNNEELCMYMLQL